VAVLSAVPQSVKELTVRGIILGGLITLVFTAANVYLGLKVGLTFATSIPAAVISMAVLRYFANHSVIENNIVQTIASAAGTLSSIIFVLPGLIMIGWWTGFPFWTSAAICAVGGILGVMYSIPLRRALVTGSDLPYPEGVAAAVVLKVGESSRGAEEGRIGIRMIATGSVAGAGFVLLSNLKVLASDVSWYFRAGPAGSMLGASLSMALIGVGHLVGLGVGIAMLVGMAISFGIILPIYSVGQFGAGEAVSDVIDKVFSDDVRMIGAGTIAIASIWTLLKIMRPIIKGITSSIAATRNRREGQLIDITERDIPFAVVASTSAVMMIPIAILLWDFAQSSALNHSSVGVIAVSVVFIAIVGFIASAICGYMAGLVGSSNSPVSGVGILVVVIAALAIKYTFGTADQSQALALMALTLIAASVTFCAATIANDNLQDLKTGQLVGATPWKQQVALIIGVAFGSLIIPPVLDLMQKAFGFAGAPGAGSDAMAAPQAALMSSLIKGVLGSSLDWSLLGIGALIGIGIIAADELLIKFTRYQLPPLAVGMGMYLPMSLTVTIPLGAFLGHMHDRWAERSGGDVERKKRVAVLMATGLIVGESLYGVFFAGVVAATGKDDPFEIFTGNNGNLAEMIGITLYVVILGWLYKRSRVVAMKDPAIAQ